MSRKRGTRRRLAVESRTRSRAEWPAAAMIRTRVATGSRSPGEGGFGSDGLVVGEKVDSRLAAGCRLLGPRLICGATKGGGDASLHSWAKLLAEAELLHRYTDGCKQANTRRRRVPQAAAPVRHPISSSSRLPRVDPPPPEHDAPGGLKSEAHPWPKFDCCQPCAHGLPHAQLSGQASVLLRLSRS